MEFFTRMTKGRDSIDKPCQQKSNMEIQDFIEKKLLKNLDNKFNNIFITGLALKGFFFGDMQEVEEFAKLACRCEDNYQEEKKIYFVNDVPFLIYFYGMTDVEFTDDFDQISITASCGSYAYL